MAKVFKRIEICGREITDEIFLLPCPFCGERELEVSDKPNDSFVACSTCKTTGPDGVDLESAIVQWQKRWNDGDEQ